MDEDPMMLIKRYIQNESKYGGYASINEMAEWLKRVWEHSVSMEVAKYHILNFIHIHKEILGLQEASSWKEIGLLVYEYNPFSNDYKQKNYLFIRLKVKP